MQSLKPSYRDKVIGISFNDGYNESYLKHVKFAKREYQLLFVATGFMFCMEERSKFPEGHCQRCARIVGCSHGTRFFL